MDFYRYQFEETTQEGRQYTIPDKTIFTKQCQMPVLTIPLNIKKKIEFTKTTTKIFIELTRKILTKIRNCSNENVQFQL